MIFKYQFHYCKCIFADVRKNKKIF